MSKNTVALRIQELCTAKNLTLKEFAYTTGIPLSTLTSIVNHYTNHANMQTIEKICTGLSISVYDFFNTPYFKKRNHS